MLEWAEEISPNLASFLKACSKNPLDTYEGIALSGQQVEFVSSGRSDFSCDDIAGQDIKWLMDSGRVGKFVADE
ncbi:hypothetical protein USDA257_c39760 [Sinorhizobium fredii USDA 257]|uniref:Uncharacterized protein n=2 Tax=Rhizobium fredii TaxID=380 RepID=I3X9G4_SINF2|nr:hypothetical protein USDA257_c39760 [Sinorhizobium fredii USDA 257]